MNKEQLTIVVAVIKNKENEILIAQRNDPGFKETHDKWEFVGGGIDFGETPEEAVVREVKEETGLTVEVKKLLPKIFTHTWTFKHKEIQIIILTYECKIIGGQIQNNLDKEIKNIKFISVLDIKNYDCLPNVKEIAYYTQNK